MDKQIFPLLLIALALVLAVGTFSQREKLARLYAAITIFSESRITHNFSHMDALFHSRTIPKVPATAPLPVGEHMALPNGWSNWLARRRVTGIVVLRNGAIVHESYHLGTKADDLRISWSVAKSFLSSLFGIMLAEGHVDNLDSPVTRYAPSLKGSAYDGASIRDVLQMSSGVQFDEDYLNFWSDINKMGRVLALGASMDRFAASQQARSAKPGTEWAYVSIDTHVLGMVLRGATGRSLPEMMGDHVLGPLGVESPAYYLVDGFGTAFALGGLNLTTRDYARFGEMFRNEGRFDGRQIVPRDWVLESTRPSAPTEPGELQYGYQWWGAVDARIGEFFARGVYGQFIYIDKDSGTVIAVNGADRNFRDAGAFEDALDMFRQISQANEA